MLCTIEGPDGSGKTTQAGLLSAFFKYNNIPSLLVREPGGTPLGEDVRNILLNKNYNIDPIAETMLFSAARAQIVKEVILPALQEGLVVICDRFYDSTYAYQGYGRGVDLSDLQEIIKISTYGLVPDVTFIINVPFDTGLKRRFVEGGTNRLDKESTQFHSQVSDGYALLSTFDHTGRIVSVDGLNSIAEIHAIIAQEALERYRGYHK